MDPHHRPNSDRELAMPELVNDMRDIVAGEEDVVDRLRRILFKNALQRRLAVERAKGEVSA